MTLEQVLKAKLLKNKLNIIRFVDGHNKNTPIPSINSYVEGHIPHLSIQRYVEIELNGKRFLRNVKGIGSMKYFRFYGDYYTPEGHLIKC